MSDAPARIDGKLAIAAGVPFGVFMGVFNWLQFDNDIAGAIVIGVLSGLGFGIFMGWYLTAKIRQAAKAITDSTIGEPLTKAEQKLVHRAARRGPVPSEPRLRQAAMALAEHQDRELRRTKRFNLVVFPVLILLSVSQALNSSPWFWLATAFFCGLLIVQLLAPGRSRKRLQLLGSSGSDLTA